MKLVAVVLNWNGGEDTLRCLESLRGVETICVDNGSTDGSPEQVAARFPETELVRLDENAGFAGGNNAGIRLALERGADWVLLLNNDAVADAGISDALARAAAARPDAGVLACKIYLHDDVLQYAGARFRGRLGYSGRLLGYGRRDDGRYDALRDVDRADGAAMALSRAALDRVGLLDEELFAYAEDVEWSLRARRAGFAVVFVPDAKVWHRGSASTGGTASTAKLYYATRNTLSVCERYAPLPPGLRSLRRAVVLGAHLAQALRHEHRSAAVHAVLRGRRDFRAGRMGPFGEVPVSLARHKRNWEELAAEDPLWAVLTDPARRQGRWTIEDFLRTGQEEIEGVLARAAELGVPASFERALDFGCGAGRLTRALAGTFRECVGVDISDAMLEEARRINADCDGCRFVANETSDLGQFADASFDFVYSSLVLQHLPGRDVVASYLAEFVRVLAPGGAAAFQLPVSLGRLHRLQASRRIYGLLRSLRVPERVVLRRTPFTPMRMLAAPEEWVRMTVETAGGKLLGSDPLDKSGASRRYWVVPSSR